MPAKGNGRQVWPIELHVGGTAGNHGLLNAAELKIGVNQAVYTLFFDSQTTQAGWYRALERASGCFNVLDHYTFSSR